MCHNFGLIIWSHWLCLSFEVRFQLNSRSSFSKTKVICCLGAAALVRRDFFPSARESTHVHCLFGAFIKLKMMVSHQTNCFCPEQRVSWFNLASTYKSWKIAFNCESLAMHLRFNIVVLLHLLCLAVSSWSKWLNYVRVLKLEWN